MDTGLTIRLAQVYSCSAYGGSNYGQCPATQRDSVSGAAPSVGDTTAQPTGDTKTDARTSIAIKQPAPQNMASDISSLSYGTILVWSASFAIVIALIVLLLKAVWRKVRARFRATG